MRLVSFHSEGNIVPGIVRGDQVLDIHNEFSSVLGIIEGGREALERLEVLFKQRTDWRALNQDMLVAPIPNPVRNLFCVGWNYMSHYQEGVGKRQELEKELPEFPAFFTKSTTAINGPFGYIRHDPSVSDNLDYEGELGVIIGRAGRNIAEDNAMSYVFGYTVANDVSARDLQRKHGGQWFKGKALDTSAPVGPCIITKDEIPNIQAVDIELTLNGVVMQASNTKHMIFSIPRLIAELSKGMTLLPGDILLTGTPEGVGWIRKPPVFLRGGDVVTVTIEGIGMISNTVKTVSGAEESR